MKTLLMSLCLLCPTLVLSGVVFVSALHAAPPTLPFCMGQFRIPAEQLGCFQAQNTFISLSEQEMVQLVQNCPQLPKSEQDECRQTMMGILEIRGIAKYGQGNWSRPTPPCAGQKLSEAEGKLCGQLMWAQAIQACEGYHERTNTTGDCNAELLETFKKAEALNHKQQRP